MTGLTQLADIAAVKLELRRLYIRWCVSGPTLEASSALAAMAQEETGHARVLNRLAGDEPAHVDAEALVAVADVSDWPTLVGHAGPVEFVLAAAVTAMQDAGDEGLRRNIAKIAVEERAHAEFFMGCYLELDALDGEAGERFRSSRARTEAGLGEWLSPGVVLAAEPGGAAQSPAATDVACIHCGSSGTRVLSAFGGSLMTSLMRCTSCGARFEAVRWR